MNGELTSTVRSKNAFRKVQNTCLTIYLQQEACVVSNCIRSVFGGIQNCGSSIDKMFECIIDVGKYAVESGNRHRVGGES